MSPSLRKLRWYAGCRFSHDSVVGTITISQQAVAEEMVVKVGVTQNKVTPTAVCFKLGQIDADKEPDEERKW